MWLLKSAVSYSSLHFKRPCPAFRQLGFSTFFSQFKTPVKFDVRIIALVELFLVFVRFLIQVRKRPDVQELREYQKEMRNVRDLKIRL